jgi:hypothetical protein
MRLVSFNLAIVICSCGPASPGVKHAEDIGAAAARDCTTPTLSKAVDEFAPVVTTAIADRTTAGMPSKDAAKSVFGQLGAEYGACVAASIITAALSQHRATPAPFDPAAAKEAFDELRRERWGGATFKTDAGTL